MALLARGGQQQRLERRAGQAAVDDRLAGRLEERPRPSRTRPKGENQGWESCAGRPAQVSE